MLYPQSLNECGYCENLDVITSLLPGNDQKAIFLSVFGGNTVLELYTKYHHKKWYKLHPCLACRHYGRSLTVQSKVYRTVYEDMHYKDLLGSIVRVGYCISVPDLYQVLHGHDAKKALDWINQSIDHSIYEEVQPSMNIFYDHPSFSHMNNHVISDIIFGAVGINCCRYKELLPSLNHQAKTFGLFNKKTYKAYVDRYFCVFLRCGRK